MSVSQLKPVGSADRLDHLDILRGFALFGILLVNFEYFLNPIQAIMLGDSGPLQGADAWVDISIGTLAEGKFYAIFSLLFGAGFALMIQRARSRSVGFWPLYLRRLLILLLFGLAHLLLIWSGDILLIYALVAAMMVLLYRNTPPSRLPKWAALFIAIPAVMILLLATLFGLAPAETTAELSQQFAADQEQALAAVAEAARLQRDGSFGQMTDQRLADLSFMLENALFWVPPILGFFLLGRWLLVTGRLVQPDEHAGFYGKAILVGLLLGLPLSGAGALLAWDQSFVEVTSRLALGMVCATIGAALLAFGYLGLIIRQRHRLHWLAPAGRMALTNYLLQSLFWTWVIYGYGLGLGEVIPYWTTPILTTAFFALQIVISRWWLERYRFGPAEWLWRTLTYMKLQPMRKDTGTDSGTGAAPSESH